MDIRVKIRLATMVCAILSMMGYRACCSKQSQGLETVAKVTVKSFDEKILKSERPIVAKFFASWCGPCKRMVPIDKKIASEFKAISIVNIDVDENKELIQKWGVQIFPTYVFFKKGLECFRQLGSMDEATYRKLIKKLIDL